MQDYVMHSSTVRDVRDSSSSHPPSFTLHSSYPSNSSLNCSQRQYTIHARLYVLFSLHVLHIILKCNNLLQASALVGQPKSPFIYCQMQIYNFLCIPHTHCIFCTFQYFPLLIYVRLTDFIFPSFPSYFSRRQEQDDPPKSYSCNTSLWRAGMAFYGFSGQIQCDVCDRFDV